jgi:hypothetical protein
MKDISLSKTRFMEGCRCPRLLWLRFNKADLAAPIDAQTRHSFEVGHRVEKLARELFPGGLLIGKEGKYSLPELVEETINIMNSEIPHLFEAAFFFENLHCRTDVVSKDSVLDTWILRELKMATKVKPEHIDDAGFQCYCMEKSGYKVDRVYLVHVNNGYVRRGAVEPNKMFTEEEITQEVYSGKPNFPRKVTNSLKIIDKPDPPNVIPGTQCSQPGRCVYFDYCHQNIRPGSIYCLPYGSKIIPVLQNRGITRLLDIPDDLKLTERQRLLVKSAKLGKPVIDCKRLNGWIDLLRYPLFFVDFETLAPCIPPYDGSSPGQKIPFQFSLHIQMVKGGPCMHYEFLLQDTTDPRRCLTEELIDKLGRSGAVVAWNMGFEKGVLLNLARLFPEFADKIQALLGRFVDLMIPFKSGAFTDARCEGSASIKKVLPILVPELSYDAMPIKNGEEASLNCELFVEGTKSQGEWAQLRKHMLAYCGLDTLAMVEILKVLYEVVENQKTEKGRAI